MSLTTVTNYSNTRLDYAVDINVKSNS